MMTNNADGAPTLVRCRSCDAVGLPERIAIHTCAVMDPTPTDTRSRDAISLAAVRHGAATPVGPDVLTDADETVSNDTGSAGTDLDTPPGPHTEASHE